MSRTSLLLAPSIALLVATAPAVARAAPPTAGPTPSPTAVAVEDVGDADSFGRGVNWLGLVSGYVRLSEDCSADPADTSPCRTLAAAPTTTTFDFPGLDTLSLPARASHSLLCHAQTPVVSHVAVNGTASPQEYIFRITPYYVIESEVLAGLSNPDTGVPYDGAIELSLSGIYRSRTLQPGDSGQDLDTGTRACIGGLVTRDSLVSNWGLTEAQAEQFFRRPVTIRLGIRGTARLVADASINIGTRFTGD